MALSSECEVHDWAWDPSDEIGCPVCHGIRLGERRLIKLLEDNFRTDDARLVTIEDEMSVKLSEIFASIKGENK